MKRKIRKQSERRKRRIARRLDKNDNRGSERFMFTATKIQYEIADRTQAVAAGGIGAIHLMAGRLGLNEAINRRLGLLRINLPYHESNHVLKEAILDADGTIVETTGQCKKGIDIKSLGRVTAAGAGTLGREAPRGECPACCGWTLPRSARH